MILWFLILLIIEHSQKCIKKLWTAKCCFEQWAKVVTSDIIIFHMLRPSDSSWLLWRNKIYLNIAWILLLFLLKLKRSRSSCKKIFGKVCPKIKWGMQKILSMIFSKITGSNCTNWYTIVLDYCTDNTGFGNRDNKKSDLFTLKYIMSTLLE